MRGDSRAIGYWQEMEKTRWGFRGDWYVSGDMVRRDDDGSVTYRGRADDMLKVSGKWLATREVEECLLPHHAVREVAVVGVVDDDGLTKPHAFVVCNEGAPPPLCAKRYKHSSAPNSSPTSTPARSPFSTRCPAPTSARSTAANSAAPNPSPAKKMTLLPFPWVVSGRIADGEQGTATRRRDGGTEDLGVGAAVGRSPTASGPKGRRSAR